MPARPRAVVLGGGDVAPTERLRAIAADAEIVIAADGGLRHATALGVRPDAIVGDFDSVSAAELDAHPGVQHLRHPRDKNALDLELALDTALARGARALSVIGGLGSRLDQSLAALLICARLRRDGTPCALHGTYVDVHPLAAGHVVRPESQPGAIFSVVALDDEVEVTISGAAYPLQRARLGFGGGLGVSNVALDAPIVECHAGLLVVVVERNARA